MATGHPIRCLEKRCIRVTQDHAAAESEESGGGGFLSVFDQNHNRTEEEGAAPAWTDEDSSLRLWAQYTAHGSLRGKTVTFPERLSELCRPPSAKASQSTALVEGEDPGQLPGTGCPFFQTFNRSNQSFSTTSRAFQTGAVI
ncbi:unnamed protein product [Pleuronectes platessa]|uniref:Uncharacterized protein n=1 Tax=Pleuronectes platessa TaxID=8262 RepID=A0A9N7ZCZ1_PLEPL|nr:unnamed protein product [Pleuronectes platessa]